MSVLDAVLRLLKKEEQQLNRELSAISAALAAFGKTYVNGTSARSLPTERGPRIAAGQSARAKAGKASKVIAMKSKRTPSTVARKKAVAAQKARSAKMKAAKKSA